MPAVAAAESHTEIVVALLLLVIVVLVTAARVLRVPYPIFLVIGGGAIGFIPGLPEIRLNPDLVLLIFLPPLLYSAAFFTSLREMRSNVRPISLLSIGLVLATCGTVAVVAHELIGLSWAASFLLGAIVSPTDPVAATAIAGRIGVPQRVVDIVEGESLINDATALVAYRVALAAVLTGSFSAADAAGKFVLGALGGVAIGLAVGWVVAHVRQRLDDPPVEITISILTAYLAYLPAEELGASGVVAAVTIGLYMGSQTSRVTNPTVRIQSGPVWQILVFLLNSILFLLIGLQLPAILDATEGVGADLVLYAVAVSATVIAVRLLFVFSTASIVGFRPDFRNVSLIGWMGMRGAVSLAAALALPLETEQRDLIVFVVFAVILVTLVLQGLSLPAVIKALGVVRDDSRVQDEENRARVHAARAALAHLDSLAGEHWTDARTLDRARGLYDYRHRRFTARFDEESDGRFEDRTAAWVRLTHSVIGAQRDAIEQLRRDGVISDEVMRRVEFELDLEETRLYS